jgi:hypothetical protein
MGTMHDVLLTEPLSAVSAPFRARVRITVALAVALAIVAAPSLVGPFDPRIGARIVPAILVGMVVSWFGPRAAARLPWRSLLVVALVASIVWMLGLAVSDGFGAITAPVARPTEYLATSQSITSPHAFLSGFTDRIDTYPVHVRGHPPGMVLLLWWLGSIGLGGAGWATAIIIAVSGSAACAVLLSAREVAGEHVARAAAPFLILVPAAVWMATSADALFMGMAAWGIALVVLATGRGGRAADTLSLAGGVVLGGALFLTYGVVPLLVVPCLVALARREMRVLLIAGAGVAAAVLVFIASGFWWLDGLLATRREYLQGIAGDRGYWFFLAANLGALSLAVGPATVAGLTRLRPGGTRLLVGGALLAVALADLSGMSRGEVERIWLIFVPWLVVATSTLTRRSARAWLAMNAATGLALQTLLRSPW